MNAQGDVMVVENIRVLVIDDHSLIATALARALATEPQITITGVASSLEQLEALCRKLENQLDCPDVAVIDYQLPGGNGFDAALLLRQHYPSLRSVLISTRNSVDRLREALEIGCVAHVNKASQLDDLIRAVQAAARGEATFDAATLQSMIEDTENGGDDSALASLSNRESQILAMLAGGITTEIMAAQLHLSQHTVRNHVRNLTAKLGAHSRLEAVSIAARSGLFTLVDAPKAP